MMEHLTAIACAFGYLLGAGFTFQYIKGTLDGGDVWESPGPLFASIGWPLAIAMILGSPITKLGYKLAQYQIMNEKKKELTKTKVRIELLQSQKELREIEEELEEELNAREELKQERMS
jgi:hypothetical protein